MSDITVMSPLRFIDSSKGIDSVMVSSFFKWKRLGGTRRWGTPQPFLPCDAPAGKDPCGPLCSAETSSLAFFSCGSLRSFTHTSSTYANNASKFASSEGEFASSFATMQHCHFTETMANAAWFQGSRLHCTKSFRGDNKGKLVWAECHSEDKLVECNRKNWSIIQRTALVPL